MRKKYLLLLLIPLAVALSGCHKKHFAPAPATVEIIDCTVVRGSLRLFQVKGMLSSNTSESCRVEITACLYHQDTGELVGIATHTVNMGPANKYTPFSFQVFLLTETAGDIWPDHTVEITDVEIEY